MLSALRKPVSSLQHRLAAPIARAGVSPDLVTLSGIPLSLASALAIGWGHPVLALGLAVPAALTDFLDGAVARLQGRVTAFGNCLEAVVDRWVEGVLLVALALHFPLAASSALLLSLLVSYVKARAGLVIVSDNADWPGLGDRTDRLAMILLALLFMIRPVTFWGWSSPEFVLWALAGTALVGFVQRMFHARRLIVRAQQQGNLLPYLSALEGGASPAKGCSASC